jgi:hypothetical protein
MSALEKLPPDEQRVVRTRVRALLERSPAYAAMPGEEQRRIARGVVDTVAFLANAGSAGADAPSDQEARDARRALARGLAEQREQKADKGVTDLKQRLAKQSEFAGGDFKAGAMEAGTKAFKELVTAVDFPDFVSGLIEGVFTSIVDSSIRQMQAYSQLLEGVVQSVEQFAADNVTMNQARDYAVSRFPTKLSVSMQGNQPRLALKDDVEDEDLTEVKTALGLPADSAIDLDDEESEAELVRRAQLDMARIRQQQLATMVLLGINRIVVTDGLINAKVVFDVKAEDTATRRATASMHDTREEERKFGDSGGWFSSSYDQTRQAHKAVVTSAVEDQSESRAEMKAKLSGEVKVNFKSETFPLDQMASSVQIGTIGERAQK